MTQDELENETASQGDRAASELRLVVRRARRVRTGIRGGPSEKEGDPSRNSGHTGGGDCELGTA